MDKKTWSDKSECRKANGFLTSMTYKAVVFYDLETTGVHPKTDYVIQFFGSRFELKNGKYQFVKKLELYIKPPIPVPKQASDVNHITNEFLNDKPSEAEVFPQIKEFFGDLSEVLVSGYNILKFDNILMDQMYQRNLGIRFNPKTVDTIVMARELVDRKDLEEESYKLTNVGKLYGIVKEDMHNASSDVAVTAKLFHYLLEEYRDIASDKVMPVKSRLYINRIYPFNKGRKANYVIIKVTRYEDGKPISGQVHYDVYNERYVEDEGDFFDHCNMIEFAEAANKAAGGDIRKFKDSKEVV